MLREKKRLSDLKALLMEKVIKDAVQKDQSEIPTMAVVDIREVTDEPCIVCIGGIVGELIIIFTCMQEYIQSTPELSSFKFRPEMLEKYIREVLVPEYSAVSTKISLTQTLEQLNGGTKPTV